MSGNNIHLDMTTTEPDLEKETKTEHSVKKPTVFWHKRRQSKPEGWKAVVTSLERQQLIRWLRAVDCESFAPGPGAEWSDGGVKHNINHGATCSHSTDN